MSFVNRESVTSLALRADPMRADDVLRLALETFGQRAALSSSFGAEDMVLIDMLVKIDLKARIFTLDTGRLPQETYNVIDATRQKYGTNIEMMFPQPDAVQSMVGEHGMNLFCHYFGRAPGSCVAGCFPRWSRCAGRCPVSTHGLQASAASSRSR